MTKMLLHTLVTTLYFLALINPISKVSVLAVFSSAHEHKDFMHVAMKASLVAGAILLVSMLCGSVLLQSVFRVELYSLRLAGGSVLCWVGFNALRKGVFFEYDTNARFEDVAIVPLACPLIAGPATIAACISIRTQEGFVVPIIAIILAVALNHIFMMFSRQLSSVLVKFNLLGAIVRLTGLVVMTIGTQMVLDGLAIWHVEAW